jgi:hypothetical protein
MQDKSSLRIFREWRLASRRAMRAESALLDAEMRSLAGLCSPPAEEEHAEANALRARARTLFRAALAEVTRVNLEAAKLTSRIRAARLSGGPGTGLGPHPDLE